MPAEGCGVDADGERRILFEDASVVLRVPITARGVLSRSRGQPAIHSSISAHDGVRPRPRLFRHSAMGCPRSWPATRCHPREDPRGRSLLLANPPQTAMPSLMGVWITGSRQADFASNVGPTLRPLMEPRRVEGSNKEAVPGRTFMMKRQLR